jgi:hypothetical protein
LLLSLSKYQLICIFASEIITIKILDMKKNILLLGLAMLFSVASAFAQGGTTGPLTWNINNEILTISGEGAMPDYGMGLNGEANTPWNYYTSSITTVVITNGVTSIGNLAFWDCRRLISITISNSVTRIGESAFCGCESLISITIPNSVTTVGESAFIWCESLISIDVENGNSSYTSEEGVLFNKSKTILICYPIGKTAETYVIPNSVTTIGDGAFYYCRSLTSVTIPNGVTSIGEAAFSRCRNLLSVTIFNGAKTIGKMAFDGCGRLTSITIPCSVVSIGEMAFSSCSRLISITNLNPVPIEINPDVFKYVKINECTLEVPISSVPAYQNAEVWKEFNITNVGIETIEADVVKTYPNPTSGQLIIDNGELTIDNYIIFNITGQMVMQGRGEPVCSPMTINVESLPSGIYFLQIECRDAINRVRTAKFVKE